MKAEQCIGLVLVLCAAAVAEPAHIREKSVRRWGMQRIVVRRLTPRISYLQLYTSLICDAALRRVYGDCFGRSGLS